MTRRFAKVSEEEIEEAYFYPSDLVNTKTTIPLRVGEERWIHTSTGVKFGGKNGFAVLSTKFELTLYCISCTSTWWLDFFKHVICNKQNITC